MKLIKWIFAVGMSLAFGAAASTQQKNEVAQQDWVFDGCDEIKALQEGKTTVIGGGSVTFTGNIECGDMATLEFKADTVIKARGGIHTKNVVFVTNPKVRAVFSAPTVTLEQGEYLQEHDFPILLGLGTFEFEVTKELFVNAAGAPVDKYGLTEIIGGDVRSNQQIMYTKGAIIASLPSAFEASSGNKPGSMFPSDPYLLKALAAKQARVFGRLDPATTPGTGSGGGRASGSNEGPFGDRDSGSDGDKIFLPEVTVHAWPGLEVGDKLETRLRHTDGRAALSVSYVDGSVRLVKAVGEPPRNEHGVQTGPQPESFATLLRSDPAKVMEVHLRRQEIANEEKEKEEEETAAKNTKKSKVGRRERKLRERAKAHLGEVVLTVSDRGVVEVTKDGTTVLKTGGPSFFGYRRKDSSYQLRPTSNGLEMMRRGKVVWSVTADGIDHIVP